jgi:hypothetical protein
MKRLLTAAVLVFALSALVSVPMSGTDPFMGWQVTDPPFQPLTYSIQTFLWYNAHAPLHADWVRLMAFSHIKQTFAWEDIEPQPGVWAIDRADAVVALAEEKGLRIVARLSDAPDWAHPSLGTREAGGFIDAPPDSLAAWARFCGVIAERYRGRIAAYQVWNEPNLAREWGGQTPSAPGYVALLAACSTAIRAADPAAVIISAGLAPTGNYDAQVTPDDVYLQHLYDAGFTAYADVVGMHAPGFSAPLTRPSAGTGGHRFFTFRRVEDLRRVMVANGDAARQAAILETGWTTDPIDPAYAWFAVDEATQARYLVEAYRYAAEHWRPWVGLMSSIYIADPAWTDTDEERWWAVTTPDNYTRPAFGALANMAKWCGTEFRPERDPGSPEALGLVPTDPCG